MLLDGHFVTHIIDLVRLICEDLMDGLDYGQYILSDKIVQNYDISYHYLVTL